MTSSKPETELDHENSSSPPTHKQRSKQWLWLLLPLIALSGGVFLIWRNLTSSPQTSQSGTTPQPTNLSPTPVKLSTVQTGTVEDSSEFIAHLTSSRSVALQSQIQGQVTQIFVRSGSIIKQGATVIQIDPPQQIAAISSVTAAALVTQSQLDNARSTLNSLETELTSRQLDVKTNQQEYDRYTKLASEGAVSRQNREQYANRLSAAKIALSAVESKIQSQRISVSQAEKAVQQAQTTNKQQQNQQQYYRITAPLTGVVGNISVKVGDIVNNSTQLVTISQNQPLEVQISLPIEQSRQVRQGTLVEILDIQGKLIGTSSVASIEPNVNNTTPSMLAKASYNNSKGELKAEQFVRTRLIWNQRPGILVPAAAISRVGGETFVYLAQTQPTSELIARKQSVKLGKIKGNKYPVIEGLETGTQVVTSGLERLSDGESIVVEQK
ncbi:efflux RND transporter periplasmic adaptor subunit [Calothrix sp. PCC 6303]|uniref:efflux RND transporter periplasmic adaptor subunit n=1 Tax=Calothrix sp. PCC 6303 TaxID=1170562 RepID=UPI0002A00754|nr:efflux RND transporter periplasmic adaptor subunit [Calothrix sp. PCC 6303]AFZ01120.1 efflux transporter, RND family, MFP subunit [Calothrix sp. PCC 6303]